MHREKVDRREEEGAGTGQVKKVGRSKRGKISTIREEGKGARQRREEQERARRRRAASMGERRQEQQHRGRGGRSDLGRVGRTEVRRVACSPWWSGSKT